MTTFSLIGSPDPFLHVSMKRGDKIFCESNAMVMMEDGLELKGKLQGGLGQALLRRFANDESLFQQHIEAVRADGDCLLSPTLDGDMEILDVGDVQYTLTDGAFVAATHGVDIKVKTQGLGTALFGDMGGFFVMNTAGKGQVVVSGYGSLFKLDVTPDKDILVDNGHVVCWDSRLQHEVSVSTSQNTGLLASLVNSATSGEGMVLRFKGQGSVVVCSRNRSNSLSWLQSKLAR